MVVIERKDPYGTSGFMKFDRLNDALNWLATDSVKQDIEDGFTFSFKDDESKEDDYGG